MTGGDDQRIEITLTWQGGQHPSRVDVIIASAEGLDREGKPEVVAGILRGGLCGDEVIAADADALQELARRIGAKAYLTDDASPVWATTADAVLGAADGEYPLAAIRELLASRILRALRADDLPAAVVDARRLAGLIRPVDGPRQRGLVNLVAERLAGRGSSDESARIATVVLSDGAPEARAGLDGARSRFEWYRTLTLAGRGIEAVAELDALLGDDATPELVTADAPRFIWSLRQTCAWAKTGADPAVARRLELDALALLGRVEVEGSADVSRVLLIADLNIALDRSDDAVNVLRDARSAADGLDDPQARDSVFRMATIALQGERQHDSDDRGRLLREFFAWHEAGASAERSDLRRIARQLYRKWGEDDEADRIFRLATGLGDDPDGVEEGHYRLLLAASSRLIECEPTAVIPIPVGFEQSSTPSEPAERAQLCAEVERLGAALAGARDAAQRQIAGLARVLASACRTALNGRGEGTAAESARPGDPAATAADRDAEREPWRAALVAVAGEEPLSGAAAHLLAVIAASADDDATVLRALRSRQRYDAASSAVAGARCIAAVLVRLGSVEVAVDELVAVWAAAENLDDEDAFRLLRDLRWIGVSNASGDAKRRANMAARELWLTMRRPPDYPSTAPSGQAISRDNADVVTQYGMVFAHLNGPWEDVWRACATEAIAFLTPYWNDPLADGVRRLLAADLYHADDPADAFAALCGLLESPGGGGMSGEGSVYHGLLERLPAGHVGEFDRAVPDGFSAEWRAKITALAAERLTASGATDAAVGRVLGELRTAPVLGDFESERVLVEAMQALVSAADGDPWVAAEDTLLASGPDEIGWNTRRLLTWYRAFRRKAAGDVAGAVQDALTVADQVSSAGEHLRPVRRDARRILNYGLDWLRTTRDWNDGLRDRVLARAVALHAPPDEDRPVAGYGIELAEWVKALRSAGMHEPAVAAARKRVDVAIADGDDPAARTAIDALREAIRDTDLDGSAEWLEELTALRARCLDARLSGAHTSVLWWRAHRYHALDRDVEAVADVTEASSLWAPDLDVSARLSILRLTMYCLEWAGIPDAASTSRNFSTLALARVEETDDDSDWWAAGAGIVRAKALVALGRCVEAVEVLRGIRNAADHENKGWERDEVCDVTRRAVAQQDGLQPSERARQLGDFLVWHARGPSDDRAGELKKAAETLAEWGADDAIATIWADALSSAADRSTTSSLVLAIALQANVLIAVRRHQLGITLCMIAERSMAEAPPQTRHLLLATRLIHLNALGDVDSALSTLDECLACLAEIDSRDEWLTAALRTVQGTTVVKSSIDAVPSFLIDEIDRTVSEGYLPGTEWEREQLKVLLIGFGRNVPPALDVSPENRQAAELVVFASTAELLEAIRRHDPADSAGEDLLLRRIGLTIQSLDGGPRRPDDIGMLATLYYYRATMLYVGLPTRSQATAMDHAAQEAYEAALADAFGDAKRALAAFDDFPQARGFSTMYEILIAAIARDSTRDDVRAGRLSWIRDRAVSDALALDARAAASRSLARRESLLAAADGAWEALAEASLDDSRMIAQVVAMRRASLVMADAPAVVSKAATIKGRVPDITAGVGIPQEIVNLEVQDVVRDLPFEDGELARAASATVLQALGDSEVAVRPRPAVRMPDGRIALAFQLRAAMSAEGPATLTPVVVPLA